MRLFLICFLALSVAACSVRGTPDGGDKIGAGYSLGGARWASGAVLHVYVKAMERSGKTRVCGAWAVTQGSSLVSDLNQQIIDAGKVEAADGSTLVTGLGFMQYNTYKKDPLGQATSCVLTETPWNQGYSKSLRVNFPRMRFTV